MSEKHTKIIVSDIGGTNSRFAAFETSFSDKLSIRDHITLNTCDVNSFDELLARLSKSSFIWSITDADIIVLAVPGSTQDNRHIRMSNVEWPIRIAMLEAALSKATKIFIINDFVAQAYGCLSKAVEQVKQIKAGKLDFYNTLAIIGAGTGLGYCALRYGSNNRYTDVPSEGGHALFSFTGLEEMKFQEFVMSECNLTQVRGDDVLSGRGLAILHRYLTGKKLNPSEIASEFTQETQTKHWFARFYGRACRNYALTVLSLGGLFLSGGIATKNPALFKCQSFIDEFMNSLDKAYLLEAIPIFVIQNELFGLWGAATYGLLNASKDGDIHGKK
ncbi:glucokinase [uncultured Desulfobacter sp.]|uniref:glucokinase n=1 Tax=uncultured Desulfobacter sp. TaxID=240139 RepID=UPI0029F585DD|nr:glucokinase [uncultured Desulfobacter sp.]